MATDTTQLASLIRLLEDDSPVVRESVLHALSEYGDRLSWMVRELDPPPTPEQWALLNTLILPGSSWLLEQWQQLEILPPRERRLEKALGVLSRYIRQSGDVEDVRTSLDDVVEDFRASGRPINALHLAHYLQQDMGLTGDRHDYHTPTNNDLYHVMMDGTGLPISLVLVYRFMGERLGLRIEGCNHPGHFLAKVLHDQELFLVDCFNDWEFINFRSLTDMHHEVARRLFEAACSTCTDLEILQRVLANLINSYRHEGDDERARAIRALPMPAWKDT